MVVVVGIEYYYVDGQEKFDSHFYFFLISQDMLQVFNTIHLKNPGISDIAIRQDQRIFATGGWDGR